MQVLVVNGFGPDEPAALVEDVERLLVDAGHRVERADLASDGFDRFMSPDERAAYHTDHPLLTEQTRRAASAISASDAIVVCYRLIHGTCPPRVKSWQERVFVLGVGFRFKPSGRITGALDHLQRACVVAVSDRPDRAAGRRNGQGRSLARSFHLSSNRRCRASFLVIPPDERQQVSASLARW